MESRWTTRQYNEDGKKSNDNQYSRIIFIILPPSSPPKQKKNIFIISQNWYNIKNKPADRFILWCLTASLTSWTHPLICLLLHFPAEQRTNLWLMLFTSEFLDARMAHSQSQTCSMKVQWCVGKHCSSSHDTNLTNVRTPWWWHSQEVLKHVGGCVLCSHFSTCKVGLKNFFFCSSVVRIQQSAFWSSLRPMDGVSGNSSSPRPGTFCKNCLADIPTCKCIHILAVGFSFCIDFQLMQRWHSSWCWKVGNRCSPVYHTLTENVLKSTQQTNQLNSFLYAKSFMPDWSLITLS
jgi:hypothetical protein